MLQLTTENALDYLRSRKWIGGGQAHVEALSGGVSNAVFRVITPEHTFVLKQSQPRLRTQAAWFSNLDRVYREQEVMEALHPLLPEPTVPAVLFSDRANFVFAMSHAPAGSQVWKEALLAGEADAALAQHAGFILGRMHEGTAHDSGLAERFGDHAVFVQLRVEPFYRRVQERWPDVAPRIEAVVDRLLGVKEALCHGDYSPKNILTHPNGFTLVDYETAHFGDPTMDLGFFLSHLILKAVKHHRLRQPYFDLTRAFWRGYSGQATFAPLPELQTRGIEHFAVCALARIDGTSPVDYLPEEPKREAVRRLGRRVLQQRPARWDEVLAMCEMELTKLD